MSSDNTKIKPHSRRTKFEKIKQFYSNNGCVLLSNEEDYKNQRSILKFECSCGNPSHEKSYQSFKATPRCNNKKYNCKSPDKIKAEQKKYEEIKERFANHGCVLLSPIYKNERESLDFKCACEMYGSKPLNAFELAPHCRNCEGLTVEEITQTFISHGCELLEEINSIRRDLEYKFRCACENIDVKSLKMFYRTFQCGECDKKDIYKEIQKIYEENGAILLASIEEVTAKQIYDNDNLLKFQCICERIDAKIFRYFIKAPYCSGCSKARKEQMYKNSRVPFNVVKQTLESKGYTILMKESEYKGAGSGNPIPALCPLGHECKIYYPDFNKGSTCCRKCGTEKRKATCMKIYGAPCALQNEEVKEKGRQTCMKKYNASHPMKNKEIRQKVIQTCIEKYNAPCSLQNEEVREKGRQTCMEKYNVPFSLQSEEVREKGRQTCMEKYNVPCSLQSEEVREKGRQTCKDKYGSENPMHNEEIKEKVKRTMTERHGVPHAMQSEVFREKAAQTCLEKYGGTNPMHDPEICEKAFRNAHKFKEYEMPSGKIINVQGYEPFCLNNLLEEGYREEEIITGMESVPEVWYYFEEAKRRYYTDIYIPKDNLIIEVKSDYTFEKEYEKNMAKAAACVGLGFDFEFRIYSPEGELLQQI